jgi:ketosteroid isomerase-like protein
VRAIEKRPESAPKPETADRTPSRAGGANKPTFDLSESGGGYIAARVRAMENRWQTAVAKHDVAAVDELVADDFIGTSSTGRIGSKSTLLRELKGDDNTYSSATARGLIVRAFGPTVAVVTGTAHESGTTRAGRRFTNESRFTDTWMERDGRWQCIASHATQLPKK